MCITSAGSFAGQPPGPSSKTRTDVIKFSFRQGGEHSFLRRLHDALGQRQWEVTVRGNQGQKMLLLLPTVCLQQEQLVSFSQSRAPQRQAQAQARAKVLRSGIGGIEKSLEQRAKKTDSEISKAFQDLDKLMEMAKPMVSLAKSISGKIRVRKLHTFKCCGGTNYLSFSCNTGQARRGHR